MRETQILMGMPVTVEIVGCASKRLVGDVFDYFAAIDRRFSLFKPDSEITAFNQGRLTPTAISSHLRRYWRSPTRPDDGLTVISIFAVLMVLLTRLVS